MIRSLITVPILMHRTCQVARITTKVIRKDCAAFSKSKNGQQKDGSGKELGKMEIKKSTNQKITNMKNMDIRQPAKENQVTKKEKQNGNEKNKNKENEITQKQKQNTKEENKEKQVTKKQKQNGKEENKESQNKSKNTNTKSESESWWDFFKKTFTDKNFLVKTFLFGGVAGVAAYLADYSLRKQFQDREFQQQYQNSAEYKHKIKMEEKFKQCTEKILTEIDYYVQNNRVERQFRRIMASEYLHLVSGFPGTGKTTTAYHLINQLRENFKKEGSPKKVIYISLRDADQKNKSSNQKQKQQQKQKQNKQSCDKLYKQLNDLLSYAVNILPNKVLDGSYLVIDDINRLLSVKKLQQSIEKNKFLLDWLGGLQNNFGLKVIAISSSSTYHENIVPGNSSFKKDDLQSITIEPPTKDQIKLSIDKYISQRKNKNEFVPQIIGKYLSKNYVSLRNIFKALDKIKIKLSESQKNKNQQQKLTEFSKIEQIDINLCKKEFDGLANSNKELFEADKQLLKANKIMKPQQMLLEMFAEIKKIEKRLISQSNYSITLCQTNHLKKTQELVKPDQIQLLKVILKKQRAINDDIVFKFNAISDLKLKRQQSSIELTHFCNCLQFKNVTSYGQPRDEMDKMALQKYLQKLEKRNQNKKWFKWLNF